jgi:hypothetical protein
MRRVYCVVVAAALAVPALAVKYYVREDFDGAFPPEGWVRVSGGWVQGKEGPWGPYAIGVVNTTASTPKYATFESPAFTVPPASKVHWQFWHDDHTMGVPGSAGAEFYLRYDGTTENVYFQVLPWGEWKLQTGDAAVTRGGALRAGFSVWVTAWYPHSAYGIIFLDNVRLADGSMVGVSPASLGRVKALFR